MIPISPHDVARPPQRLPGLPAQMSMCYASPYLIVDPPEGAPASLGGDQRVPRRGAGRWSSSRQSRLAGAATTIGDLRGLLRLCGGKRRAFDT